MSDKKKIIEKSLQAPACELTGKLKAYHVTSWSEWYEPLPRETKCQGPLKYYKAKVFGYQQSDGYRRLMQRGGKDFGIAFGLFHKLLELAATWSRESRNRGWILDSKGNPATPEELEFVTGFTKDQIEWGISILLDIGWIEWGDFPPVVVTTDSVVETTPNETEQNETEPNENKNNNFNDNTCAFDRGNLIDEVGIKLKLNPDSKQYFKDIESLGKVFNQMERYCRQNGVDIGSEQKRLLRLAQQASHGDKPIAVFISQSKKEWPEED